MNYGKRLSLEALRGMAAIVVVVWHCLLDFKPDWAVFHGSPFYALIYGTSAVAVFFVLSGYVLSIGFFAKRENQIILRGAVKRWPRLAGPVLVSCLITWALYRLNLFYFMSASEISGSAHLRSQLFFGMTPNDISFFDAARVGLTTFFTGDRHYNNPIWTMHYEFLGSLIVFAMLFFISKKHLEERSTWLIIGLGFFIALAINPYLSLFPIGLSLVLILSKLGRSYFAAGFLLIISLYLLGYAGNPIGAYSWIRVGSRNATSIQIIGAAGLVAAFELFPLTGRQLGSSIASFLGRISFPLYLIHVPVLCSLGSFILIRSHSPLMAISVTLFSSIGLAFILSHFNEKWISCVDKFSSKVTGNILQRQPSPKMAAPQET